jgi:hypothetical protein
MHKPPCTHEQETDRYHKQNVKTTTACGQSRQECQVEQDDQAEPARGEKLGPLRQAESPYHKQLTGPRDKASVEQKLERVAQIDPIRSHLHAVRANNTDKRGRIARPRPPHSRVTNPRDGLVARAFHREYLLGGVYPKKPLEYAQSRRAA